MEYDLTGRVQKAGDIAAFEQLVKDNQSPVRIFLRRLLNNDFAVADELAQETFLKAFLHINTYRAEGKFLSWLFRIAYQLFVAHTRKQQEQSNCEISESVSLSQWEKTVESKQLVHTLVQLLAPDEKVSILLSFSHGLSHAEIADVMNLPIGSVKTMIRRSRLKLKSYAKQIGAGQSYE
jgi:RNA polymerase sigma-70 factor (ECF subfamily)